MSLDSASELGRCLGRSEGGGGGEEGEYGEGEWEEEKAEEEHTECEYPLGHQQ